MKIAGWSRKSEVLSYFEYPQPDGTHVKRYIEPLHGTARHPGAVCGGHDMMDLKYLLPENACTESGNRVTGAWQKGLEHVPRAIGGNITNQVFKAFKVALGDSFPMFPQTSSEVSFSTLELVRMLRASSV